MTGTATRSRRRDDTFTGVADELLDAVSEATGALAPIDLDTLDAHAELQQRVDRKYVLDLRDLPELLASRPASFAVLEIDGLRRFGYESIYFDTPALDSYHLTAHRRRRRFKVRSRLYCDSGLCMLEVKLKGRRGLTVKHRIDYDAADRWRVTEPVHDEVDRLVGRAGVASELAPVLATTYGRRTIVDQESWSRCTIDTELVCTDMRGESVELGPYAIIETKSAGSTGEIDRWLWSRRVRPSKISKFCVGAAALHPDLPSNKWNRTLNRYFRRADGVERRDGHAAR